MVVLLSGDAAADVASGAGVENVVVRLVPAASSTPPRDAESLNLRLHWHRLVVAGWYVVPSSSASTSGGGSGSGAGSAGDGGSASGGGTSSSGSGAATGLDVDDCGSAQCDATPSRSWRLLAGVLHAVTDRLRQRGVSEFSPSCVAAGCPAVDAVTGQRCRGRVTLPVPASVTVAERAGAATPVVPSRHSGEPTHTGSRPIGVAARRRCDACGVALSDDDVVPGRLAAFVQWLASESTPS